MAGADGWGGEDGPYSRGAYSDPPDRTQRRYRRREPASHTYEAERFQHGVLFVCGVGFVAGSFAPLAFGEIHGLMFLFFSVGVFFLLGGFWMPYRVTLDASGVLLQALVRRVRIPWDALETVAPPLWDTSHGSLMWRRRSGLAVLTLQTFPDLHRMLVEIERRAPHVHVSS